MMLVIDHAASRGFDLPVRFAALMHDLGKGVTPADKWPSHHGHEGLGLKLITALCRRLKVPNDCRDLALMTAREHGNVSRALSLRANTLVTLFERCDGLRKPARFGQMLQAAECDFRGRGVDAADVRAYAARPYPQGPYLAAALEVTRAVDAGAVAAKWAERPERIREAVHAARVSALKHAEPALLTKAGVNDNANMDPAS
jgi:tRNA nucleotidyltransferase (CCA-adding enzyme)